VTVRIGCHVSAAGGLSRAVPKAEARGCEAVQVFTTSPRQWRHQRHPEDQVAGFREGMARLGIAPVVVHASYLLNLATRDSALRAKSLDLLVETGRWSAAIGAAAVILHPGIADDVEGGPGVRRCAGAIRDALSAWPDGLSLSLEQSAGQRGTVGGTLDHFAAVLDALGGDPRISVWLDTARDSTFPRRPAPRRWRPRSSGPSAAPGSRASTPTTAKCRRAAGRTGTRTWARGRSGRPGSARSSATLRSAGSRSSSKRRGSTARGRTSRT
jgi:hypothetical protein